MNSKDILAWLLQGDVSIQFQGYRDMLGENRADLQERISREGWGRQFLEKRHPNGHWGIGSTSPSGFPRITRCWIFAS